MLLLNPGLRRDWDSGLEIDSPGVGCRGSPEDRVLLRGRFPVPPGRPTGCPGRPRYGLQESRTSRPAGGPLGSSGAALWSLQSAFQGRYRAVVTSPELTSFNTSAN